MSNDVSKSFAWKLLERGGAQIITLIVQIILARLLLPEEFGVISIILVFVNIANVFIQKGFASSLVRKKEVTDADYNTAFLVSECIAIFCILLLFLFSNLIEQWYNTDNLSSYLRVLSVSLIFGSLYSIQNAELIRNMRFKSIFIRGISSALVSGLLGIVLAYYGFGAWALIYQSLIQQVLLCIFSLTACKWRPKIEFSVKSFKELFNFGSKILFAELLSIGAEDLRSLIIGKKYSSADLAYYDRGQIYPSTIMRSIYDSISSVFLPVYSKIQDEKEQLAYKITETINISLFFTVPLFIGFASVARPFVLTILTDKWANSIPFLVLFCIYQLSFPIYGIARQGLYSLGKSTDVLVLEIIKSCLYIVSIVIGVFYSPMMIAILSTVCAYISMFMYLFDIKRYIPLKMKYLLVENLKTVFSAIIMFFLILLLNRFITAGWIELIVDVCLGIFVYICLSIFIKNKNMLGLLQIIKNKKGDMSE